MKEFKVLRLDLQFFSDGDDVVRGGYNPDEEIAPIPEGATNPLMEEEPPTLPTGDNPSEGNEPQEPQEPQQPEPEVLDFGGRKVDPRDPNAVKQAHEDFQNAQRYITELAQQNQQITAQMNQLMQQQQQVQQQPQQPQEPELSVEEQNERMMEEFYDNPTEFFQKMRQNMREEILSEAKKEYEPIVQERRYQEELNSVAQKYGPDFNSQIPQMQNLIQERGQEWAENVGLENVYLISKGMTTQTPSPEQLLQDENFVQQHILNNPDISNKIIQQYANNKQQQTPPPVMGNTQGGQQTLTQQVRPKTISEAGRMLRREWNM